MSKMNCCHFTLGIFEFRVKDSEPDSLKALFDVIPDIISLKPLSNSNAFTNQYEGMDWQKKLAEFAMLVLTPNRGF